MIERYRSNALRNFPDAADHVPDLYGVESLIYNRIWRPVFEGKLKPGTKLNEAVIGETFEVSRTVVRKVLVIMEHEGIVELPPNHGAFVATPSFSDALEALVAAQIILTHIASELAVPGRLSPDNLEQLRQHISDQIAVEEDGEFTPLRVMSDEFQILLAYVYGNRILASCLERLIARLTLAASIYRRRERPSRSGSSFQSDLLKSIVVHNQKSAVASVERVYAEVERSLSPKPHDEELDLRNVLSNGQYVAPIKSTKKRRKGKKS